jgi:large conductance mechanosensitive channel
MATAKTTKKATTAKTTKAKTPVKRAASKAVTKAATTKVAPKKTAAKKAPVKVVKTKETKTKDDILFTIKKPGRPAAVTGFVDFLREQSVVGLAIGLVIGAQVKSLADSLIANFINPLVGLLLPGTGALDKKHFALTLHHKTAVFNWGTFMVTLLSFMTTAAVVYFVFKSLKLDRLTKKKDADKKK